jgi:hypothetical protein
MKTEMGFRYRVSGLAYEQAETGFRVSGFGYREVLSLILFFLCGFPLLSLGQEMKYQFKKGQIMEYQYKAESADTTSGRTLNDTRTLKTYLYLFEFLVDSLYDSGAYMTLTPKQYSQTNTIQRESSAPLFYQKSFIEGTIDPIELAYFGDLNQKIHFQISTRGQLSNIWGNEEIFNDIAKRFQHDNSIHKEQEINYNWLKLRYSEDYYRIIIRQFLPPLPDVNSKPKMNSEPITLKYLQDQVSFWFDFSENKPDPASGKIRFINPIIVAKANYAKLNKDPKNKESHELIVKNPIGIGHWDMEKGIMDTMEFQGTDIPLLLLTWVNDDRKIWYSQAKKVEIADVKVELVKLSKKDWIHINLDIYQADSMEMEVSWPLRGSLDEDYRTTRIRKDTFEYALSSRLDHPGFIDIYFYRPDKSRSNNPDNMNRISNFNKILNPDKIRVYAENDDSICIDLPIEHSDNITFTGSHVRENQLLNRLFRFGKKNVHDIMPETNNAALILEGIREDQRLINESRKDLDPKFLELIDFELLYLEKRYELSDLLLHQQKQVSINLKDTLQYYKKFLGRMDHLDSFAYLGFIQQFLWTSLYNSGINQSAENQSEYRSAEIFLQGWDRYWMLAKLSLDKLRNFDELNYADNYRLFIEEYPDTPYGKYLQSEYNMTRYFDYPSQVAKLDLKGFIGSPVIVSIDYEKSKNFIEAFIKEKQNLNQSKAKLILYVTAEDQPNLLHQLQTLTGSTENNLTILSASLSLIVRDMTEYLSAISKLRNPKILIFDRNGRFISYFKDHYDEVKINNMLSWP